jgi:hypothetical protein
MTRDQLEELAKRLEYATRDVVTGERLDAGVYGHAPIEDLEEAAAFIRSLLAQKPVAWQSPRGNLYPSKAHAVANGEQAISPLYAAPVPAVDPDERQRILTPAFNLGEWKAEAMRLADAYANPENGEDYLSRAALAAHLDKIGGK